MKLFLKILLGFVLFIALTIGGFWFATKQSNKLGPTAAPLEALNSESLKAALDGLRAEQKLVGLAAKVVVEDQLIAEAAAGWKTSEEQAPLGVDDLFHIGSIGKSMTATTIARLVEAGQMDWSDTIGERLNSIPHDPAWADVTVEQLLTHRASIPRPPISSMINEVTEPVRLAEVRRETAETLLADAPETTPGTAYAYSNTGYMLASVMAEEATGQSWETLIQTQLFEPLGLTTAGFGPPLGDAPFGHRKVGPFKISANPNEGAADNPPWMAAAGTLHMSLDDLLTFGKAHLDAGQSADAILSAGTFETLHTPFLRDYAYGWIAQDWTVGEESIPVIWHNGSNTMWYTLLVIVPEHQAIIILASNDASNLRRSQRRFDDLAKQILTAVVTQ